MKQLSIEDKAKCYDEAVINGSRLCECGEITRESYEYIFPELKESEDERIKKWIRKELESKYVVDNIINNVMADKALAWLEKQGEQKPAWLEKQGEQKPAWSEYDEMFVHGLIRVLAAKKNIHGHTTFSSDNIYITNTIDWLKSLKDRVQPQSQWKPSDEQIELLREVQQALLGKDCHNRFVNFIYELKRLREE